jgi:PKD repeat protein
VGETVQFSNHSAITQAPIKSYYWHFGFDGKENNSTEQNPTVVYSRVGKYAVKLTVTDEKGAYATAVDTVFVIPDNLSPRAAFSSVPQMVTVEQPVNFTSTSSDDDGYIVSYKWDFGNGQTSTESNPQTSYAEAGFYSVSLTVTDDRGAEGTDATSIMV